MDAIQRTKQKQLDSGLSNSQKQFNAVLDFYGLFQPESKYKIVCPFHDDVNASCLIDLEISRFYCFGCGKAGGAFDIVQHFNPDKKPFEVLQIVQRIMKGDEQKQKQEIKQIAPKKRNLNAVKDYYFNLRSVDWNNDDEGGVKQYLRKRGFTAAILNQMKAKINENMNYPIIFPIMDNKVFRGYVCRTMSKEVEEKRKYLYNAGFRRANTLAGTYGETDTVLIVEGYMDMVKAKQMGVTQVVAILGWKISEKHVKKLKRRGIKNIVCGLDADESGRKGYKYLMSLKQFEVSRLHYPKGVKDFGDVTKKIFNQRIKNQLPETILK